MWTWLRAPACMAALVFALTAAFAGRPASAVSIPVDTSGQPQIVQVVGSGGGSMFFSLGLGPQVEGSFALDVFNVNQQLLASINIAFTQYVAGTGAFGNITIVPPVTPPPPAGDVIFSLEFRDIITWQVNVAAADLSPVTLVITNNVQSLSGETPVSPPLDVTFTGDLALAAQTPLPGALPLFASGLGVLGFAQWRRRRRARAA